MAFARGRYLRTNYRLTGGKGDVGELGSILVGIRITIQHDSATGDVVTFSMEGYGVPSWVLVMPASAFTFTFMSRIRSSLTAGGSLVYLSVDAASGSMGSMAATLSQPYNILALIASR